MSVHFRRLSIFFFVLTAALTTAARYKHRANYDFEGIVGMNGCSGSLVRLQGTKDTDSALILTAGHCYEGSNPSPGRVYHHLASDRSFDLYDSEQNLAGELHATELLYATMTKTDLAIYRLKETYSQIKSKFGIRPFTISRMAPTKGSAINIVSGYIRDGYSCSIEAIAHRLKEDGHLYDEAIRYSQPGCEIAWGTSGSPAVVRGSRAIIGINTTVNLSGLACTTDNACEIDAAGEVSVHQGAGYAQEAYWLTACVDQNGQLTLSLPGCQLPK